MLMPEDIIKRMKLNIVIAAAKAGEGHIASAFSVLDILWVLYYRVLKIDPQRPYVDDRDRFILSKGHASLGLYAVLLEKGFWPGCPLDGFAAFDSRFGGHPDRKKLPGVEASTGSLGHGFPMAVGIALGLKIRNIPSQVYALVGDGEANEGTVWESALLAAHHRLGNLCCIVDYNHSTDRALSMGDFKRKFEAFGWEAVEIDGHDHTQLQEVLIRTPGQIPLAVVAMTVKGKGCRRMENEPAWHHRAPKPDELTAILEELT